MPMVSIRHAALVFGLSAFALLVALAASPLAALAEGDWS
jgi:hypothetical protein